MTSKRPRYYLGQGHLVWLVRDRQRNGYAVATCTTRQKARDMIQELNNEARADRKVEDTHAGETI